MISVILEVIEATENALFLCTNYRFLFSYSTM